MQPTDRSAQDMLARVEQKADLRLALSHLNPTQVALFLLVACCDFTVKEAGQVLGINRLQAQTLHDDAVRTLRRLLAE